MATRLSHLLILALLAGLAIPGFCQVSPTERCADVPDYTIYQVFFRRVLWLDGLADQLKSQGKADSFTRSLIQRESGITEKEAATLRTIAAEWIAKDATLVSAGQAAVASAGGPASAPLQLLKDIRNQRIEALNDDFDRLRAALGYGRFPVLDHYVRRTCTISTPGSAPPGAPPPPPRRL